MTTLALDQSMCSYSPAEDRSLGPTGTALRELLIEGERAGSTVDRGDEIYKRVSSALHQASETDGTLVHPDAFSRALELLTVLPREVPLPEVVVESENEIGLDWDRGRRQVLSLTVRDTPMIGFAGLFGEEPLHGRMGFAREMPPTLRFLLTRLFRRTVR